MMPYKQYGCQVPLGLKGNPVKFGNGPAAVTGDEIRRSHCPLKAGWEGSESRMIRKSEDLPDVALEIGAWRYPMT